MDEATVIDSYATSLIDRFTAQYGRPHLYLAYHAALPLILTPELLNYLRNRFLRGEVPWVAEIDLLLSELCRPVGYEQYAMDNRVRAKLLEQMAQSPLFGRERMAQVARVLIQYIRHLAKQNPYLNDHDLRGQQWAAMVYLENQRATVVEEIAEAIGHNLQQSHSAQGIDTPSLASLVNLVGELAPTLADHGNLVEYAQTIGNLLTERVDNSTVASSTGYHNQLSIANVVLPALKDVFGKLEQTEEVVWQFDENHTHALHIFNDTDEFHAGIQISDTELDLMWDQINTVWQNIIWLVVPSSEMESLHQRYPTSDVALLEQDLIKLALFGGSLYLSNIWQLGLGSESELVQEMLKTACSIVITTKDVNTHTLPLELLYSHPIDIGASEEKFYICPDFSKAIHSGQSIQEIPCFQTVCRFHDDEHVVCPSGFIGYRHNVGQSLGVRTLPYNETSLSYHDYPDILFSMESRWDTQARTLRQHQEHLNSLRPESKWNTTVTVLQTQAPQLIYLADSSLLYRSSNDGEMPLKGMLDQLEGSSLLYLSTLNDAAEGWQIISTLLQDNTIIGGINRYLQLFSSSGHDLPFAENFMKHFLANEQPVGESLRLARLNMLQDINPLGLLYGAAADPRLKLQKAESSLQEEPSVAAKTLIYSNADIRRLKEKLRDHLDLSEDIISALVRIDVINLATHYGLLEETVDPDDENEEQNKQEQEEIPETIGQYRIESVLGSGSIANVYLAIDMQLQRRVALKVLKPQWSLNAAYINAYQREADLIARLSHPHIVAYYSMGQTADKSFYIAMEYLDRGTLSEELERTNKFSIEEAIRYIEQIAGALGYAHRNNILHLDVKPQNILLRTVPRRPLEAVLVDFGIARAARAYEDDLDTVEPSTLLGIGTGPYLSPEQVQDGVLDQRTDIYSLAVTTYEIMTGELPYKAGNLVALVNQIVTTEPPTPSSFGVPDAVSQVILKGMQKSPVYRYETANEFAAALRAAFDRGIAPEPIPDQQTTTQPSPPTERWDRIDTSATETIITIVDERRLSETPANLNELTEQLMQVFSLLELKGMSFDFNIDRNVINTNNAAEFVTQLLTHVNRQNRLDEFLSLCEQMKPDINWQQFKS